MSVLIFHRTARKVPLVLLLWFAWNISPVQGQGVQVVFANLTSSSNACGPRINAPIYGLQGRCEGDDLHGNSTNNGGSTVYIGPLLAGTGYTAALFAGTSEASAQVAQIPVGQTTFRTGTAAGYINMRTVDVPWFTPEPGRKLSFQVRAWDNRGGTATSWSTALGSDTPIGWSDVITPSCPDPLPGQPQQIYLTGLTSFNTWLASAASQAFSVTSFTTNVVAMPGTTATLAAEVYRCRVSSGIVNQQWWRADRPIPGATNSMLVLTNVSSIDAGDYVFVIGPTFFGQSRYTMRLLVPPRFTAIQFSPPRTATLTYDTGRELNVTVQAATSLSNWVNLHTGPATGQFQDNNATNQTRRYRLRLEP